MALVNLTGWADPELAGRVKDIAKQQKRSVSFVVVEALKAWVEAADKDSRS